MAGIDKTYFKTWEQYIEVCNWADAVGVITDEYGNRFSPRDFIIEWTKKDFDESYNYKLEEGKKNCANPYYIKTYKEWYGEDAVPDPYAWVEFVLWNTPTYFDVWLIRNCPVEFIQTRLKEQYGKSYEDIKNHTSEYDEPRIPGSHKFKVIKIYDSKIKADDIFWWVQIIEEPKGMWYSYSEDDRMWYEHHECKDTHTNTAHFRGNISKRKLARIIKRWNLPKGVVLRFNGSWKKYEVKEFLVRIM